MLAIFLSASIPDPKRDAKYHDTADKTAIRDAVRALITVVLPHGKIVWGGHPAITPLVKVIAEGMGVREADKVVIFQSNFFKKYFPKENSHFEKIVRTRVVEGDRNKSLALMRKQMIESERFDAGVFIGGMEGVEEEYRLFTTAHVTANGFQSLRPVPRPC